MPKSLLTRAPLGLAILLLAGCQLWNPGGSTYTDKKGAFSVHTPFGWQYATAMGNDLTASKDGPVLQQVWIEHRPLNKALTHSKRELTTSLAPFEVAEAVLDDLRADHTLLAFDLKENAPASVGGVPGFKLTFSFRTAEKLRLSESVYGVISGDSLWLIHFRAPSRHYFERDLATFEETVKSFKFGRT